MSAETALRFVAWTAGGLLVLTMLPDAGRLGLAAAAVTATAVVLARWWHQSATVAVQVAVVGLAVEGVTAGFAAVAGFAASLFLLATHLPPARALLTAVVRVMLPAVAVFALAAGAAATFSTGLGWLTALVPLLVVGLYASTLLPFRPAAASGRRPPRTPTDT